MDQTCRDRAPSAEAAVQPRVDAAREAVVTRTLRDEDIVRERRPPSIAARDALDRALRRGTRRTDVLELSRAQPAEPESEPDQALAAE